MAHQPRTTFQRGVQHLRATPRPVHPRQAKGNGKGGGGHPQRCTGSSRWPSRCRQTADGLGVSGRCLSRVRRSYLFGSRSGSRLLRVGTEQFRCKRTIGLLRADCTQPASDVGRRAHGQAGRAEVQRFHLQNHSQHRP